MSMYTKRLDTGMGSYFGCLETPVAVHDSDAEGSVWVRQAVGRVGIHAH